MSTTATHARIYVIVTERSTGRWYALNRAYGLLRGVQGNAEDCPAPDARTARVKETWRDWQPTHGGPEWAEGATCDAVWYEGAECDPDYERGFEIRVAPRIDGFGVLFSPVLSSSRWRVPCLGGLGTELRSHR